MLWQGRLGEAGPNGFSASPVGVDGKVFFTNDEGETFVLKAGKTFELLHVSRMNEKMLASPAMVEGTWYFRTHGHLLAVPAAAGARRLSGAVDCQGAEGGADPADHDRPGRRPRRRPGQAARRAPTDTVAGLVTDYLKHAEAHKQSAAEDRRILERDVLPRWQQRSVRELTRRDVRAIIEAVAGRGAPIMANRTLAVVRKMLNFAVDHDWIDASPAARVQKPAPEQARDRVLTDDEIRRLWRCLGRTPTTTERPAPGRKGATGDGDDPICPLGPTLAATLKVPLLTAQLTRDELRTAINAVADEFATARVQHMVAQLDQLQQRIDAAIEAVTTAAAERRAEVDRIQRELERIQQGVFDEPDAPPGVH